MHPDTSLSLLQRLRHEPANGPDWRALEAFCRPFIFRQLRARFRLGEHDTEDLAQNVMEVVCRKVGAFDRRGAGSFRRWLRTITHRQLQNFWREQQKQPQPAGEGDPFAGLADDRSDLSREWDEEHRKHVVEQALDRLRGDFGEASLRAFRLLVLEGRPGPEVASGLGMRPAAVHSAKARILARLRAEVEEMLD
jgi:RNA polymerase sigma-70 factor (ECF subfamily)